MKYINAQKEEDKILINVSGCKDTIFGKIRNPFCKEKNINYPQKENIKFINK